MSNKPILWMSAILLAGAGCSAADRGSDAGTATSSDESAVTTGVEMVSAIGSKCLADAGGATTDGNTIHLYQCDGGVAQLWSFTGGTFVGPGGKCLDVSAQTTGAKVELFTCNGSAAQKWTVAGSTLKSSGGLCLDVKGGVNANGTQIDVATCVAGSSSQSWSVAGVTGSAPPPNGSAGCGKGSAGTFIVDIKDGAGNSRPVKIIVPSGYNKSATQRMTTVFGGVGEDWEVGTNGTDGYGYTGTTFESRSDPGIVVYPETSTVTVGSTQYAHAWDDGYTASDYQNCTGRDQTLYLNAAAYVEANYCVDTKQESIAGFSWGGDMVVALTCCHSAVIHAAAVASATDEYSDSPPTYNDYSRTCKSAPGAFTTPIRFTHDASNADSEYPAPAFEATHQMFLLWLDDSPTAAGVTKTLISGGAKATCYQYTKSGKATFIDCGYTGLGHHVPTTAAGETNDWSTDTIAWFNSF